MNVLDQIQAPIATDLESFRAQFQQTLKHENPLLKVALNHVLSRRGKLMRPTLFYLSARSVGEVTQPVHEAALALELLHTASLVHDDVVDESDRRRGQASVNALLNNQAAVLVGDFILSRALQHASATLDTKVVETISRLGQLLADGELLQLHNTDSEEIDEKSYFEVIRKKTASLFATCAQLGAYMAGGTESQVERMRQFGHLVGACFQVRDDIFDYDSAHDVGKPTGNDMKEGKLTLPVIYALNKTKNQEMWKRALLVRHCEASQADIDTLVNFTREEGGLAYAEHAIDEFRFMAAGLIDEERDPAIAESLRMYVDFVADRTI